MSTLTHKSKALKIAYIFLERNHLFYVVKEMNIDLNANESLTI